MRVRIFIILIVLTILMSLPRFAHHTPDSPEYIDLAKYFRGELSRELLYGPYVYRILIPFLAAHFPWNDLDVSFAVINIICTILAYFLFIPYLRNFVATRTELNVGMLMLVVSFPTFNYASGVLTDPAGFLVFVIAAYLLMKEKYLLLSGVISIGVLVRESLLSMVLVSVVYILLGNLSKESRHWKKVLITLILISVPPAIIFYGVRFYYSDLPNHFYWGLSLQGFLENIQRPIGWTTFLLTLSPPLFLFLIGIHHSGFGFINTLDDRQRRLLISLTGVSVLYIAYTNLIRTAFMSGRFVWPFYTAFIPLALRASSKTSVFKKFLGPISNRLLGEK